MEFAEERLRDIQEELARLLPLHYAEVALDQDSIKLQPAWEQYLALDAIGTLHIITARVEGALVGYFLSFIHPHLHYSTSLTAVSDLYYMEPRYRASGGEKLFRTWVEFMEKRGVQKVFIQHKLHVNAQIGPLLQKIGFTLIEHVWSKLLRKA